MPRVEVHHAAPAHRGVTQIMGLSGDEYSERIVLIENKMTIAAGGLILAGFLSGSDTMRSVGVGALLATIALKRARQGKDATP